MSDFLVALSPEGCRQKSESIKRLIMVLGCEHCPSLQLRNWHLVEDVHWLITVDLMLFAAFGVGVPAKLARFFLGICIGIRILVITGVSDNLHCKFQSWKLWNLVSIHRSDFR